MKGLKAILTVIITTISINTMTGQNVFMNEEKVANNGYDVVNYFTANVAAQGSKEFATEHNGATYYFASAEHLKMFTENPAAYLPQFDGFCSFAVAKMKQKAPVNPTTFRIDDGKLYLFYNDLWEGKPFNTIIPWINNEGTLEKLALENWETVKNQN